MTQHTVLLRFDIKYPNNLKLGITNASSENNEFKSGSPKKHILIYFVVDLDRLIKVNILFYR